MAKSLGIHIGQRRFEVVVLDGSPKKHKIVHQASGEIPSGEDPIATTAAAIKEAVKGQKVPAENIGLAVDSGLAAYRNLNLPFDDKSKIEEVIKFEVENQLPQWDIDEVIIDFLTLSSTPGVESNLLVTAVPKDRLAARLRACERAGVEPYEAELDTTALFNAAHQAGILSEDGAQVLVHLGDASTSVVVVDGGRLHAMRAIHTGAGGPVAPAAEAGADDEEAAAPEPASPADLERRRTEAANRIRRELGRTISAASTQNPIEAVFVTGLELPGLIGAPIQDVEVRPLDLRPGEGGADDAAAAAVAYGVALRRLGGGVLRGTLRQEELRYSGKFERLELPLAVCSLLLLTVLLVHYIVLDKQIGWRGDRDMRVWLRASNGFMLPAPERDYIGRLTDPPQAILDYCARAEAGEVAQERTMDQLRQIERLLQTEISNLKGELGIGRADQVGDQKVEQPQSALEALTLVLGVIDGMSDARIAIRGITSDTAQYRQGADKYVQVKLDMDFLADDNVTATRYYSDLTKALQAEVWCKDFKQQSTKVIDGGGGIYVDGITIQVDLSRIPKEDA